MKTLRICSEGHQYYKSSDCPVCPTCESQKVIEEDFLQTLSAPARRALQAEGIVKVEMLSGYTVEQILNLHGVGKTTIPKLEVALKKKGLSFKGKA